MKGEAEKRREEGREGYIYCPFKSEVLLISRSRSGVSREATGDIKNVTHTHTHKKPTMDLSANLITKQ